MSLDPAEIAAALRPKLAKRLGLCLNTAVPWMNAPKSHRQLRELDLVYLGDDGTQEVALATPLGKDVAAAWERLG